MAEEYGDTPPWHDIQAAISGPGRPRRRDGVPGAVGGPDHPEPQPDRSCSATGSAGSTPRPTRCRSRRRHPRPSTAAPTSSSCSAPTRTCAGAATTTFARGGERSVARGYTKAVTPRPAPDLRRGPVPLGRPRRQRLHRGAAHAPRPPRDRGGADCIPDVEGFSRTAQLLGRRRAMLDMARVAPDRVALYGIENHAGTPIYVHAKTCIVDDTWATIGSDNFNRRSWTHDSELSAVVLDTGRRLRARRCGSPWPPSTSTAVTPTTWTDCIEPAGCSRPTPSAPRRLDGWHAGGQGRCHARRAGCAASMPPELGTVTRALALAPYLLVLDPDGRPKPLRKQRRVLGQNRRWRPCLAPARRRAAASPRRPRRAGTSRRRSG